MEGAYMDERYRGSRWAGALLAALVALAAGWGGYSLGFAHGLAQSGHFVGWYRPWGFGFGFFFPFLFFLLLLRVLFWGGPWRRGWRYGPSFEEWHARAHERMKADAAPRADV
jgi:hypothetical protein